MKRQIKALLGISSLAMLAAVSAPQIASAQDSKDTTASDEQVVIVTGSSIKRKVLDNALPLQIITKDDLVEQGISSTEQLIMNLSVNGTGLDNLASNADVVSGAARGNNGASSANLRGQGAAATLVLLNGRRVAAHGLNGGAVDINQIPFAAIERVDVLKDGASAVYGTDAIGGVINFITKKEYKGLNFNTYVDKTEEGGGDIYKASILAGFGDLDEDKFNIMGSISYSDNKILNGSDRDFVNTFQPDRGVSPDTRGTPYATIFNYTSGAFKSLQLPSYVSGGVNLLDLPNGAGCDSIDGMGPYDEQLWDVPTASYACAWDTGRAAVIQQPIKTTSFFGRGIAKLFGEHELSMELMGTRTESAKSFSNIQLSPSSTRKYGLPSTSAYYDDAFNKLVEGLMEAYPDQAETIQSDLLAQYGAPITFRLRCMECGRRQIKTTTDAARAFLGLDGPLSSGWSYRTGLSYAYSESESTLGSGYYYQDGLVALMNSGLYNPFLEAGETQSQEALDALQAISAEGTVLYGGKFSVTEFDGSVSGPLFELPAGTMYAALGFDLREEKYHFNGDRRAAEERPTIYTAPFDDSNALEDVSRTVNALYAELAVPVFKGMEITLAGRYDAYSGFGTTFNPKISFKYRPVQQLMFRGSYNTGFRVPSFNQIFNGTTESDYSGKDLADPGKCASGVVSSSTPGCESITPVILTGGKEDLGPEESTQYSLGFVFEPNRNFSFSVDWWHIESDGQIKSLTLTELVENYDLFKDRFIYDTSGNLVAIDDRWINAGQALTEGVEVSARANGSIYKGHWNISLDGSYLLEKKSKLTENSDWGESEVGVFTYSGDLGLRWKHNLAISYSQGDWTGTLTQIFKSGYDNQVLPGIANGTVTPSDYSEKVDDYITYNATVTYRGFEKFKITAGVKNIFNEDPPFAITYDSNTGAGSSWEARVADPRGRSFTLMLDYSF